MTTMEVIESLCCVLQKTKPTPRNHQVMSPKNKKNFHLWCSCCHSARKSRVEAIVRIKS